MGSGKLLKRAIKKHGVENFTKEILHVCQTEAEMNTKEKELVFLGESSYNLCPGGKGGFGYINARGLNTSDDKEKYKKATKTLKSRLETDNLLRKKYINNGMKNLPSLLSSKSSKFSGKKHSDQSKKKISISSKNRVPWNKGISRTPEEKEKIKKSCLKFHMN